MKVNLAGIQISTDFSAVEKELLELKAKINAIDKSQAMIEFNLDGTIITANSNFLNAMDYRLDEVQGMHHSLFVPPEVKTSQEYLQFWDKLNRGEYDSGEYKRIGKNGKEVWIQASYNPIVDDQGKPYKVVKFATDITENKLTNANYEGQISAIGKSQAVIEFNLDGTIITANDNFLATIGYRLDEIQGKHHRLFVEPQDANSNEYREFWESLNRGEHQSAEYKRLGKGGKEIWLQASYNPIFDLNGKPIKVVKFAADVTQSKMANANFEGQIDAIDKAQAVIEFNMDGTIITANENFLTTIGYRLGDIQGKHHSMFVQTDIAQSDEYQDFWADLNQGNYAAGEYKRLGKGGKELWLQASYNPIFDLNGKPFKVVKFASDITAQKNQAIENVKIANISSALKLCNANVMLADNDLNIVYMNHGIERMLKGNESAIRQDLPNFAVDKLLGTCVDVFHKSPTHQRGLIESTDKTTSSRIEVAGLTFDLTLSPWLDTNDVRIGTVVEWYDLTAELAEQQKERALAAANARVKLALDKCQANVMMADNDLNIIYMNSSVTEMMQGNEAELRTVLPSFTAGKLIGTCVDDFHANPAHQRAMISQLTSSYNTKLKLGKLTFDLIATPMFDDDGERLGTVVEWQDITESLAAQEQERTLASANARIKMALDKCRANVMVADNDLNIIYINDSVGSMMQRNESELRTVLPSFTADKLIGTCVDDFHANPAHQRAMIGQLTSTYNTKLKLGHLTFDLVATPIFDDNNERLGTVVEWQDMTEELAVQQQERALAASNARIKIALDKCQANVMMADTDLNIIYMNDSVTDMMQGNESRLRTALPNFNVSKLIGTCVDDFHQSPAHQRGLLEGLDKVYQTRLPIADLTFDLIATPVFDDDGTRLGSIVEWNDVTEELAAQDKERALAAANARIKIALDKCQANVMMADTDLNIIYMNDSVRDMMQGNEAKLRTALPSFNVSRLIGTCVDDFHKNPAHQRGLLEGLNEVYQTRLTVADLTFDLTATPVFDDDGTRLGSIVEWNDVSEQLATQEKERVVSEANARIKIALDKCQANVMMADTDLNIIYTNDSVIQMMQGNETELHKALPNLNVSKLIGTCIDDFHKNPAHQRGLLSGLTEPYRTRLTIASLTFDLVATPVFDDGVRLGSIVEWSDVTEQLAAQLAERRIADENARIKQALDSVGTNTMIADANNDIIYMNQAVNEMMRAAEKDIQQVLPKFEAKNLVGQSVDNFHANPAHQQGLLSRLQSTYTTEISVGPRTFSLIANPITSDEGERIGTVVEWNDRTEEVAMQKEIADLISAAGNGDLTNRIDEQGKSGFFLSLAGGLNQLVGIADGVINETVEMLDAMAHGNLTNRIESDYQGAFNKLKTDANGTAEKLTEIITRINNSSSAVASGAEEIAQGNTDLSQRTEEQASSLEETASSMEQMTATVRQNADNAKVANEMAADATTKAQKGGEVVKRAVNSMSEINDSSKKIADIIGVIDEIAFQTNLLALNAAVEAARAGEQGRGFAVVAGEVRNLAQRSAAAAKEIKDLIRDSVSKVQDGSQLVNESGATLSEIVDAISKVTTMIGEISIASNEQSEGIEQVNKAVTQMDEMTQQNAALVEEASAAGEAMADQARGMRQILGFFTTDENALPEVQDNRQAPAARPAAPARAPAPPPTELAANMDFADDDEEWEEF